MVSYFSVSTIVDPLKRGPGQMSPMPSFPAGILRLFFEITYVMLNLTVSFDWLNVRDHLLINIRYEKDIITYIET